MYPIPIPIAVLISGGGSNLQALIDACTQENYPATIRLVISNKPEALGLERAKKAGIPTQVIEHHHYPNREQFDAALHHACLSVGVQIICLAGFMRLLTPNFVTQWQGRMLNIHPSLLPKHKGAHAHRDVLTAGDTISGCTVHYVIPAMDSGEIILQKQVPVFPDDTEETLAKRVLAQEHMCYPEALRMVITTLQQSAPSSSKP